MSPVSTVFHTEATTSIGLKNKGVSIAQRSTRQARLLLACQVNLEHLIAKVDLIYVWVDSIILYKLQYYSIYT